MNDDTTIIPFHQPGSILDSLTEIAREGARQMLMAATADFRRDNRAAFGPVFRAFVVLCRQATCSAASS